MLRSQNYLISATAPLLPLFWLRPQLQLQLQPCIATSVVEPFYFGPAPAPTSQDGGFSSSSSPVVKNFLLEKKFRKILLLNLPGLFYSQKCTSALLCSSTSLLKGTDWFNLHYCQKNLYLFFKHGVIAVAWAVELEPEPEPALFSRLRPKNTAPAPQHYVIATYKKGEIFGFNKIKT